MINTPTQPFGGKYSDEYNAMMKSFIEAAEDHEQHIYDYLEEVPIASLSVEIVDKLHNLGFKIIREVEESKCDVN